MSFYLYLLLGFLGGIPAGMPTLIDVSDPARIIYRSSPDIEMPFWAGKAGA